MPLKNLRDTAALYYKNLRGWRTNRKIVVIESDDWGSIRMPSREVYEKCLKAGYRVDENPYERYDSLMSEDDLELLMEVLSSFKDKNGKPPIITANALTSNPDFKKIRNSKYEQYFVESIKDTLSRYPQHKNSFNLWMEGEKKGLFRFQSHGREHLNVSKLMDALKHKDQNVLWGFNNQMPGSIPRNTPRGKNKYVEATNYTSERDKWEKLSIVLEGLDKFKELFGYASLSYIPTNYRWSADFNESIARKGVKYIQGNHKLIEPLINGSGGAYSCPFSIKQPSGIRHLMRNSVFEPTESGLGEQSVENCLKQVEIAFKLKKPATISSHRINYVGFIDERNRDGNLKLLKSLLNSIIVKWPEVEFMSSDQLGHLIESS
jgi:hypothetical protein